MTENPTWTAICPLAELEQEWGESAIVEDQQVALFRLWDDRVMVTSNLDPRTGSAVMARGIVGTRNGVPTIASPLHKEAYSLLTGECYTNADLRLDVFTARVADGMVLVRTPLHDAEVDRLADTFEPDRLAVA
jgi:nitrite reductase (NADH) small subunit